MWMRLGRALAFWAQCPLVSLSSSGPSLRSWRPIPAPSPATVALLLIVENTGTLTICHPFLLLVSLSRTESSALELCLTWVALSSRVSVP